MNPLISVIIPIYNVELYLHQCIKSVLCQTYKNLEIILVDDGSKDCSLAICENYAQKDSRIKVFHQDNKGQSSARNKGLDIASGEYIYFLDSDDYIGKETIEILFFHLNQNTQAILAIGNFTALYNDEKKIYNKAWLFDSVRIIKPRDFAQKLLKEESNHAAAGKLYRKAAFDNLRFQVGKKNEDTLLNLDLVPFIEENNYQCIDVPIYTYFYRQHQQSTCHSLKDPFVWHIVENCDIVISRCQTRSDIVYFYRNRQLDSIMEALSAYIKNRNSKLFYKYHQHVKRFPTFFTMQNRTIKVFFYFLLLKYAPKLLMFRENIRKHFLN